MSYHWFNGKEIFKKTKDKYHNCDGKEKAAKYYLENRVVLKEHARNKYRDLFEEEKEMKREYGRNRYRNMKKNSNEWFHKIF